MFYELTIAFSSVIISFILYFGFSKWFERNVDEIEYDERRDLNGKELLLVNVVRIVKKKIKTNSRLGLRVIAQPMSMIF